MPFILGMLLNWSWAYATKGHRLVNRGLDSRRIALGKRRGAVIPLVALLAMVLSLINPLLSSYVYM